MGYDLTAVLGYGVCLYTDDFRLLSDMDEDELLSNLPDNVVYEYGGSDGATSLYLFAVGTIITADWEGNKVEIPNRDVEKLRDEMLFELKIPEIKKEHFHWYLVPKWF